MKLTQGFKVGVWLIVVLNLLMAFGAIGVFMRMAPAIAEIITNNAKSLQACEDMFAAIILFNNEPENKEKHQQDFEIALKTALNNITEKNEPEIISVINNNYVEMFRGNKEHQLFVTEAILRLTKINHQAMKRADYNAQSLGYGGAWGIVFMAVIAFLAGVIFVSQLSNKILDPIEEIKTTLMEHQAGEKFRRCFKANVPADIKRIFELINRLLDSTMDSIDNH